MSESPTTIRPRKNSPSTYVVSTREAGDLAPYKGSSVRRAKQTRAGRRSQEMCVEKAQSTRSATHLLSPPGATRFDMGTLLLPIVAIPMCVPMVHSKDAAGCFPLR